jgi:hypothetical protein
MRILFVFASLLLNIAAADAAGAKPWPKECVDKYGFAPADIGGRSELYFQQWYSQLDPYCKAQWNASLASVQSLPEQPGSWE